MTYLRSSRSYNCSSSVVDWRLEPRTSTLNSVMAETQFLQIAVETQRLVQSGHSITKC